MKKTFLLPVLLTLLGYLLFFPQRAFAASSSGLMLWFHTVLPSLLPFLIVSDILIHTGKIPRLTAVFQTFFRTVLGLGSYGSYVCLLGLFCGYPMGAKLTGDLLREQKISLNEARYLLSFTNNASPMFLSSYVLLNALHAEAYTLPSFVILYTADFLTAMVFRILYRPGSHREAVYLQTGDPETKKASPEISLTLVDTSIMNGFETITRLGGYILLFSVGASLLLTILSPFPLLGWLLPGILEITTGIQQTAQSPLPFWIQYLAALVFTAFGGLSAAAQTKGMLSGTPLSLKHYLPGKLLHALFTFFLGILFLILFVF